MFWKREPEYKFVELEKLVEVEKLRLVEVEKPRNPGDLSKEMREAVLSLQAHPGFNYLLAKFRLQRNYLRQVLESTRHKSINDVNMLQSGIYWLDWIDAQIRKETNALQSKPIYDPTEAETQALKEIQAAIETIGG